MHNDSIYNSQSQQNDSILASHIFVPVSCICIQRQNRPVYRSRTVTRLRRKACNQFKGLFLVCVLAPYQCSHTFSSLNTCEYIVKSEQRMERRSYTNLVQHGVAVPHEGSLSARCD